MKRICITYLLETDHSKPSDRLPHNVEQIVTCITFPVKKEIAEDLLRNQAESQYVAGLCTPIKLLLGNLAKMQGHQNAHFLEVEVVE